MTAIPLGRVERTGDVCFQAAAACGSVTWRVKGVGSVEWRPLILLVFIVDIEVDGVTQIDIFSFLGRTDRCLYCGKTGKGGGRGFLGGF